METEFSRQVLESGTLLGIPFFRFRCLIFFPCILIAGQGTHLFSLPGRSIEEATLGSFQDPHQVYISLRSIWLCISWASSGLQYAVGFRGEAAFQIFPAVLHVHAVPPSALSWGCCEGARLRAVRCWNPAVLCLLHYVPWRGVSFTHRKSAFPLIHPQVMYGLPGALSLLFSSRGKSVLLTLEESHSKFQSGLTLTQS